MKNIINIKISILIMGFIATTLYASQHDEAKNIDAIVNNMNPEELIGQTLMVGYKGEKKITSKIELIKLIKKYKLGSIILYKHNFLPSYNDQYKDAKEVYQLTESFQNTAKNSDLKLPLLIAIDQEGGSSMDLQSGVTRIPLPIFIGTTRDENLAFDAGKIIGSELKYLGINTVLSPVADIINNSTSDVIGKRAFGANKELVTSMSVAFMKGLQEGKVLSVGKHFPGHGSSTEDPHIELPFLGYDDKEQLYKNDLVPFKALVESGIDGIMTAHIVTMIDKQKAVTVSKNFIATELRKKLNFNRVVFTDDLSKMMGILKHPDSPKPNDPNAYTRAKMAVKSHEAGNDILIFGQIEHKEGKDPEKTVTLEEFDNIYKSILKYYIEDDSRIKILKEKVKRIIRLKSLLFDSLKEMENPKNWVGQYKNEVYKKLAAKNHDKALEIAKSSVTLIYERNNFINNLKESKYFDNKTGPLNEGILIDRNEKITIVSPVYMIDHLTNIIKKRYSHEFDSSRLKQVAILYGKRSKINQRKVEKKYQHYINTLERTGKYGIKFCDELSTEEAVKKIINVSKDSKVIILGVLTKCQINVLKSVCKKLKNNYEKYIILIIFNEPYFCPTGIHKQRNTIVLFAPSYPGKIVIAKTLFGENKPKSGNYLPVSIPGCINRNSMGGPAIKKLNRNTSENKRRVKIIHKDSESVPFNSLEKQTPTDPMKKPTPTNPVNPPSTYNIYNLLYSFIGGLLGAIVFVIFSHKSRNFTWSNFRNINYDIKTELRWSIYVGLIISLMIGLFPEIPYLSKYIEEKTTTPRLLLPLSFFSCILLQKWWLSKKK